MRTSRVLAVMAAAILVLAIPAQAGQYLSSAHGSTSYGVSRTTTPQYTRGQCGSCHEQHAMIGGSEPAPTGGPDSYLLFKAPSISQTSNVCFQCHTSTGSLQSGGITTNYGYAYSFGGYTAGGTYDADILAAFSHTSSGSSHYLPDIVSQVLGKTMYTATGAAWSLPATLSPCDACHNPHAAQRAHPVSVVGGKLNTAISLPSDHSNLWGDDASERLDQVSGYAAPYYYGSTTRYEPCSDTSSTGANAPNYVRFCTDCHNPNNTINSTNPRLVNTPRALTKINWTATGDIHGLKNGTQASSFFKAPYASLVASNITMSCLDCHEPHGSKPSVYLLRAAVNGVAGTFTAEDKTSYTSFCVNTCHLLTGTHLNRACTNCHRHGGTF